MTYYKWREMSSSGYSSWEYIALPDYISNKEVGSYLDDQNMLNNWSEHFRGVEWHKVKRMPRREIESKIKSAQSSIEWHQENLKLLKSMLSTYPKIKGDVTLTSWEDFTDPRKWKRWTVITKGKRKPVKLYNSKKYSYSSKPTELAKDWCEKNGYKITETKYEKVKK